MFLEKFIHIDSSAVTVTTTYFVVHSINFKWQGGMPGSARLRDCDVLRKITCRQAEENSLYGAICAAPAVSLLPWGLLKKKKVL